MRKRDKEVSDIAEIEAIISKADVCRVALANSNIPYIVTLNFGYQGGNEKKIYFHCANEGRKLDMIRKNNYVCFEMDTDHLVTRGKMACEFGMKYKSIIGYGYISFVNEIDEKIAAFNNIMHHYTEGTRFDYDKIMVEKTTILRLDIQEITGKRS